MAYISFNNKDYFKTKIYSGNSSTQSITGVGFQPDLISLKRRNGGDNNWRTANSVTTVDNSMMWNLGNEASDLAGTLTAFNADGFSLGNNASYVGGFNETNGTYVSYNWKFGTTSGLSGGTITPSAYSINTTSKQGVYKYSGTGSAGATIAHGLGVKPSFILAKRINGSGGSWMVYHAKANASPGTKAGYWNDNVAFGSGAAVWNNATASDTVITLGTDADINGSGGEYLLYVFCDVNGYFKASSYYGNGNAGTTNAIDARGGTFVHTGGRPSLVSVKKLDGAASWYLWDSERTGFNRKNSVLNNNAAGAESATERITLLSNGFRFCHADSDHNGNNTKYVYVCWMKEPIVANNGTVGVAR